MVLTIITGITLFSQNSFTNDDKSENNPKSDIVMSTKVSRPGCEKTDSCYKPSKFLIEKDHSVTWINQDVAFHSVTSGFYDMPSGLFDSGYLGPSESFTFIFDYSGTYDYFCTLHPWMNGQVIVK